MSGQDLERLVAVLWALDTLGVEIRDEDGETPQVLAYFPSAVTIDHLAELGDLTGFCLLGSESVRNEDWLSEYRARIQPFSVGNRWWIDPREPSRSDDSRPPGRQLLRIPARTAFGTGSHPSTRLLIEWMEELPVTGKRVLDVGTGSGILSILAALLGASQIVAFDIDAQACFIALQTCRLNGIVPRIFGGDVRALRTPPSHQFDLILANVLPSGLRRDLAEIIEWLDTDGVLLLSGLLAEQECGIVEQIRAFGLRDRSRRRTDGWSALELVRSDR